LPLPLSSPQCRLVKENDSLHMLLAFATEQHAPRPSQGVSGEWWEQLKQQQQQQQQQHQGGEVNWETPVSSAAYRTFGSDNEENEEGNSSLLRQPLSWAGTVDSPTLPLPPLSTMQRSSVMLQS
jgi:hypothetical protein